MKLADIFVPDTIVPELDARTKLESIEELVGVLRTTRRITKASAPLIRSAIDRREEMGSTGIGRGIGVPHIKQAAVKKIVGAFGRSSQGIEFQALDGGPVHLVFLIVSPEAEVENHLNALRKISSLANDEDMRRFLRNAESVEEIADLMAEADERYRI